MLDRPPGALAREVTSRDDVAMDLTHHVRVPAPLEEAWEVVLDPARVAAVLPGSTVDTAADDTFTGAMKIKLGSSLLALAGGGRYLSRDVRAHRVVVATTGSDRRGDAGVEATHTLTLSRVGDGRAETDVTVQTSMTWSGRPARLGEGVVVDAVDRVLAVTASRIAARVAEGLTWVPAHGEESASDDERTAAAVVD
ncbi:MAG: SRPBCC domain-containing protein, partial [Janthinobacterium lividum]